MSGSIRIQVRTFASGVSCYTPPAAPDDVRIDLTAQQWNSNVPVESNERIFVVPPQTGDGSVTFCWME